MKGTYDMTILGKSPDARLQDASHGTKPGSNMETNLPSKVDLLAAALTRLSTRWDKAIGRAKNGVRIVTRIHDEIEVERYSPMPAADRRRLSDWFKARYDYLDEEYRRAINDSDNIIGKQWLYDRRPVLAPNEELP